MNTLLDRPHLIISGVGHNTPPAGITLDEAARLARSADVDRYGEAAADEIARLEVLYGDHAHLLAEALEADALGQLPAWVARRRTSVPPRIMRHVLGYVTTLRNTQLDAITTALGTSGLLKFYDGTRPATGGTATTLLATLALSATAAAAAASGVLTFSAITSAAAVATATCTWWRLTTSANAAVIDGSAGTSGADINFGTAAFVSGATIAVSSLTITHGNP